MISPSSARRSTSPSRALDGVVGWRVRASSPSGCRSNVSKNPRGPAAPAARWHSNCGRSIHPYSGGAFAGSLLGGVQLGSLDGQSYWREVRSRRHRWVRSRPATESGADASREWTPAGFVDPRLRNFAAPTWWPRLRPPVRRPKLVEAPAAATTGVRAESRCAARRWKAPAKAEVVNTVASAVKADAPATKPNSSAASVATAEAKGPRRRKDGGPGKSSG